MSRRYLNHAQAYQRFFKNSELKHAVSKDGIKLSMSVGHDSNLHLFLIAPKVWPNPRYLGAFDEFPDELRFTEALKHKVGYEVRAKSRGKGLSLGTDEELRTRLVIPLLDGLVKKLRLVKVRKRQEASIDGESYHSNQNLGIFRKTRISNWWD